MQTQTIQIDQDQALELYNQYKAHRHYSTAIDREIQRAYRLIAQGRVVIRALESIVAAGLGADSLPKLAIARATATHCELTGRGDGSATMRTPGSRSHHTRHLFEFPIGSFPSIKTREQNRWRDFRSIVPLIPLHLRPKQALDEYHILFEAEWREVVPRDPYLLRRIGHADLWLVVAAWDLTDVEIAALMTRVHAS